MIDKIHPYLRIVLSTLMISPLVYCFFRLDMPAYKALFLTTGTYLVLWLLGFLMFEYLQGPDR